MAEVEKEFHDLLHPIKDLEKSFQVDIAQLLKAYISNFVQGKAPPNFNSAALLLQGSSSVYGKKVEYLHTLATHLYGSLVKHKKDEQTKKDTNKVKERHQKDQKFSDPFFSTEIKLGKNLSYLRKKAAAKIATTKKPTKKVVLKKPTFVPVDLLPFEGEEKGDMFLDTCGEAVGNKSDYTLNKCRMTLTGWLVLPTLSLDLVPDEDSPPDYIVPVRSFFSKDHCEEESVGLPDCTPDEGIVMGSQTPSEATSTPDVPLSQQTDEGLGSMASTPLDPLSQPSTEATPSQQTSEPMEGVETGGDAIEDIPMDQIIEDLDAPAVSLRRSMRQAQKSLAKGDEATTTNKENIPTEEEIIAVKKVIQKKNTCSLPLKLKSKDNNVGEKRNLIASFCTDTFFVVEKKILRNKIVLLETIAFQNNTKFVRRIEERIAEMKNAGRKKKKNEDDEENEFEDPGEILNAPDSDDLIMHNNIDANDIIINNDPDEVPIPEGDFLSENLNQNERLTNGDDENMSGPGLEADEEEVELRNRMSRDMKRFETNAESTRRVKEWERKLEPFLNELEEREKFDINEYGSAILDSFDATVEGKQKRQTKTFKDICEGMEKWKIHRYFMALLPLANIGNVVLETEQNEDEEEDILVTLISKRMHHLALEDFNNPGPSSH